MDRKTFERRIYAVIALLHFAAIVIWGFPIEAGESLFAGDEIESKVSIIASVPEAIIARGLKAGDWVKLAAEICGGGGGGRPDAAQAGGRHPEKISEAIAQAREHAEKTLG